MRACVCVHVCVRVCVCVCVVGGQDVITIQTSTMMTPQSATVSRVSTAHGVGGWGRLQMHFTLTTRVGICMRQISMEMSTDVK